MMTKAPFSPDYQKEIMQVKDEDYELVKGCGHVCVYGPVPRVVDKIQQFCEDVKSLI